MHGDRFVLSGKLFNVLIVVADTSFKQYQNMSPSF